MSVNLQNLTRKDYMGAKSTLCTGCGHDSITNQLISALFQSSINPYSVAKVSGIGCSSKTPTYFLDKSAGFNSLHGRMAPLATGAKLANKDLQIIGVSGDGDSASIGLGSFCHLLRRNLPMVYIVENNGVYGLTKGQFSATADVGTTQKNGETNSFSSIDLCAMAIEMGCGFVARSFSGDAKQIVPLLRAAFEYPGTAFIDVISPCVTFANHQGSSKSYDAVKEHKFLLQQLGFVSAEEEITADYQEGEVQAITMHDGSRLTLKKLDGREHDVTDDMAALQVLHQARKKDQFVTGLFYLNQDKENFVDRNVLSKKPLKALTEEDLRPSREELANLLKDYK